MKKYVLLFLDIIGIFIPDVLIDNLSEGTVDLTGDLASGDPYFFLKIED